MKLEDQFEAFLDAIRLGATQEQRIRSAVQSLEGYLRRVYELGTQDIFLQGSYPNGTAIKPAPSDENGEYDVDIVIRGVDSRESPTSAKSTLLAKLQEHGTYAHKATDPGRMTPCIRLEYSDEEIGGFHVDIVPAKRLPNSSHVLVPRGELWLESAPIEFTDWCRSQGEGFASNRNDAQAMA